MRAAIRAAMSGCTSAGTTAVTSNQTRLVVSLDFFVLVRHRPGRLAKNVRSRQRHRALDPGIIEQGDQISGRDRIALIARPREERGESWTEKMLVKIVSGR